MWLAWWGEEMEWSDSLVREGVAALVREGVAGLVG